MFFICFRMKIVGQKSGKLQIKKAQTLIFIGLRFFISDHGGIIHLH